MMKILQNIFLVIVLTSPFLAFGQVNFLGPELGMNVIHIESTRAGNNFQLGVQVGARYRHEFTDRFSLGSGIYLAQKKIRYVDTSSSSLLEQLGGLLGLVGLGDLGLDSLSIAGVNLDINDKINGVASPFYIEIPITANYHIKSFDISLGPTFGVLIGSRNKEEITSTIPLFQIIDISALDSTGGLAFLLPDAESVSSARNNSTDNFWRWDIGATLGIGYSVDNYYLNLSFNQSFRDYRKDKGDADTITHRAFRISVGYLFGIKPKHK